MWIEKTKKGLRLCDRYKGADGKIHKASVELLRDTPQARRKAQEELLKRISDKKKRGSPFGKPLFYKSVITSYILLYSVRIFCPYKDKIRTDLYSVK